jgi:DNA polymerase I-like protein with 3'-5' exonuclease and polymerase domains
MLLGDIACQPVTVDVKKVSSYLTSKKIGNQAKAVMECSPFVRYNQFGTVTGRLSTKKNSFPILTLNKSLRHAISPQNNYFVELDFNGAEVRTLLGMLGAPQPAGDVHDFHLANVFSSSTSREQAKVLFFSWLYGSKKMAASAEGKKLENFYDRPALLDRFYSNSTITTPFGKVMNDVDRHLALNYLVQSTTAELTLKQALKIDYLLRRDGSGSTIAFLIHDAIVLDMKKEDEWLLPNIKKLMSSTNFGKFVINTKAGKTLGTMRKNKIG